MKPVYHSANSRGQADHGWLKSFHSFSFANYYEPQRMHFGALRVLNDDFVEAGRGFGLHPHDNMEIVSIPLSGALQHSDSTGRKEVIKTGDVQIMSAGTGIMHSEMNASTTEPVRFLQIWVFPEQQDLKPRYEQKTFKLEDRLNQWQLVVSPEENKSSVWINQQAWFSLTKLSSGTLLDYTAHKPNNCFYLFLLEGQVRLETQILNRRDALGLKEINHFKVEALQESEVLLMELPDLK